MREILKLLDAGGGMLFWRKQAFAFLVFFYAHCYEICLG